MSVDIDKELEMFTKSCNGRFKAAFDKGFNALHERFNDGSLNKRWRGWLQHAHWSALTVRDPKRVAAESPEQEGKRLFFEGVPAAKVYSHVSDDNVAHIDRVMGAFIAQQPPSQHDDADGRTADHIQ